MRNKSGTSAVALAKEHRGGLKKQSLNFYKNHKKTSLTAGTESKGGIIIIIISLNRICRLFRNLLEWKDDSLEANTRNPMVEWDWEYRT